MDVNVMDIIHMMKKMTHQVELGTRKKSECGGSLREVCFRWGRFSSNADPLGVLIKEGRTKESVIGKRALVSSSCSETSRGPA